MILAPKSLYFLERETSKNGLKFAGQFGGYTICYTIYAATKEQCLRINPTTLANSKIDDSKVY